MFRYSKGQVGHRAPTERERERAHRELSSLATTTPPNANDPGSAKDDSECFIMSVRVPISLSGRRLAHTGSQTVIMALVCV